MSEWREDQFDEIMEITSSKRIFYSEYVDVGVPFYRSKEIIEKHNNNEITSNLFISEERFAEIASKFGVPKADDILLTSVGSLGIPYLVKESDRFYFKDGNLTWLKNIDKTKVNVKFLLSWLNSKVGKSKLDEITIGSTQPALTISGLKTLLILLPPLEEQRAIAGVLSSLDDKIDLLHRQNATLEKIAETLFRQYFIENAKPEWEDGKLGDEFDFTMGASPPGESYNETDDGIPMYQGNADFNFRFPKRRIYTTDSKRLAEKYDTLISVRAPVGAQNMANEECCIGRGVAAFRYRKNKAYFSYTYYKLMSLMEEIKQFNETGTVFGSISKSDFESIDITIPDDDLIFKFQNTVQGFDDKIFLNSEQIRTLTALRDTLLPKLMSGEVRVKQ